MLPWYFPLIPAFSPKGEKEPPLPLWGEGVNPLSPPGRGPG